MFRFAPLFLAGMFALLAVNPACAVDLFAFEASGRVLAFAVRDTDVN